MLFSSQVECQRAEVAEPRFAAAVAAGSWVAKKASTLMLRNKLTSQAGNSVRVLAAAGWKTMLHPELVIVRLTLFRSD